MLVKKMLGINLPELAIKNSISIIKLAQSLHRDRKRNKKWNKYWIDAYDIVLIALKNNKGDFKMAKVTNKKLDKKLEGLVQELNKIFAKHELKPIRKCRIKVCNNQFCIENSKDITGYLRGKRKNIPICGFRNFCPDAHYHYFNYKPEYVKKGDFKSG